MTYKAIGLIEVRGYLGAVVAADIAVKAANVSLLNIESIRSGLNTVQLEGDIGAVKAAVDSVVDVIRDEPYYLTSHVIPRVDSQTTSLFSFRERRQARKESVRAESFIPPLLETEAPAESLDVVQEASLEEEEVRKFEQKDLEKLKVVQLRSLAYKENTISLTKKEIKFAGKKQLLDALTQIIRKE